MADDDIIFQQYRNSGNSTAPRPPPNAPPAQPATVAPPAPPSADDIFQQYRADAVAKLKPSVSGPSVPGPAVPGPDEQSAQTGLPLPGPPPPGGWANALQPAPNTTYGTMPWMWVARDNTTGQYRFAMPSSIRDVLTGNVGPETTVDPSTGQIQYGMTPGANLLLSGAARPLVFSGDAPLLRPPSATFGGPLPPTAAELTAAVRRAGEPPPRMATELEARLGANAPPAPQVPPTAGAPQAAPAAAAPPVPAAPTVPTHVWASADHDFPVTPTGVERTAPDGRVFAEVQQPNGTTGYVPKDELQPRQSAATAPAGAPAGATQPTGAQVTPPAAAQMTPEEIATQRTVADKQWLNQTQQPGVPDTSEKIPGITPNLVEQEQTVTAARELKALKNLNPELSQAEREILDRNNDLRKGFYADTVGSDVTRAADLKAANDKIETDLQQVWSGKGEADPANVQAAVKTELVGSAGDLPPLKSAMKQVSDSLENAGTDPQAMYRTHRLINYLQSRQGQLENPGYGAADVQAALTRVKGVLAQTIDDAAPGFSKAMSDYAGARGPIGAAKALQDRENGLYDSQGRMSFLKVHGLMRDIIDAQKWDAPNDPLAGVSDAQMARLKALHDDLKRTASAKDLATAQGSDTAMNAVDIAKAYGKLAGRAGIEGAANLALGPGIGSMVVRGAENLLRPITSGFAARGQIRRGMEILQPPPTNPLQPP